MSLPINRTDVELAADDLRRRTLSHMPVPLERMIYLGSTRDYNTRLYYHDGLASRFSDEVVCVALWLHRRVNGDRSARFWILPSRILFASWIATSNPHRLRCAISSRRGRVFSLTAWPCRRRPIPSPRSFCAPTSGSRWQFGRHIRMAVPRRN